jgi:phytoene synthase
MRAELAHCEELLRRGSKSFSAAARMLPAHVREPATILYAFCRLADDEVDDAREPGEGVVHVRRRLDRVYGDGRPADPVERALAHVVAEHRLPREPFEALVEGFAWDAGGRTYEDLDELLGYAARVASSVGVLMTLLMGRRDPIVLGRACDLGAAMQLTNIARDVAEDAGRGRIYLPLSWLRDAGIDAERIAAGPHDALPVARVIERVLQVADVLYARADGGIAALPPACRPAIRAARLIYAEIGAVLRRARCDPFAGRAVVSPQRKAVLGALALAARPFPPPVNQEPPLAAFRFLIDPAGVPAPRRSA